jgi:hypothetical protein
LPSAAWKDIRHAGRRDHLRFSHGFSPAKLMVEYGKTIRVYAYSLITISAMLAIGI